MLAFFIKYNFLFCDIIGIIENTRALINNNKIMEQEILTSAGENGGEERKGGEQKTVDLPAFKKRGKFCAAMPSLFFALFAISYYVYFQSSLPDMLREASDISNIKILSAFTKYGAYAGALMAFFSMIIYSVLALFKRLLGGKNVYFLNPFLAALSVSPWYYFAYELIHNEPRYTDIGRAVITFVGGPAMLSVVGMFVVSFVWLFIGIVIAGKRRLGKRSASAVLLLPLPFLLTGCVGELMGVMCDFFPDGDHCWQGAAVQEGKNEECEKIEGKGFSGSNPPRDKCYLMIAENTGDLSACEQIEGGPMSYTREECILGASIKNEDPSGCKKLEGSDRERCVSELGPKLGPGGVIEIDDQIEMIKNELKNNPDPELEKQLKGLEGKRQDILDIMTDGNKKTYESMSDPLNRAASLDYHLGKIDEKTKDSLIALNDRLRDRGEGMSEKEFESLRDMLAYKNDPKNNIENMDERELLKLRWNEKVGNAVDYLKFWNSNATAGENKLDEQLMFYERMLERQAAIDKGMSEVQQDADRNLGMVKDYLKDKAWEKGMDEAKKAAFEELMDLVDSPAEAPVTAVLGEAIETVKKEAKSKEFRGLVRAYNLGMEEELAKAGGDVERAHAAVIANLEKNPYNYEDQNTFAKYGNILENKDCDGSNPHCIQRDVFWKAMKKSYKYQNQSGR